MTNDTKQATPPAMNAASPTGLTCVKCHSTKRPDRGYCTECGETEFKPWDEMVASFGKVVATVGQDSATSGEAVIKRWKDRLNDTDAYGREYTRDIEAANAEIAELRAALAAKAEQANTAGAAKGGNTKTESAEQHAGLAPVAWRRVAWIDGTWIFTTRQPTEEIAWEPLFVAPVAERASAPASVPEGNEIPCPACGGSGETMVLSGGGPDAYEVPAICPHCNGTGGLDDAYRGVCALLAAEQEKYLAACGKLYFAAPEVAQPAAQGESIEVDPEFRKLAWRYREANDQNANAMLAVLIDCINAWGKSLATPAPTAGEPSACPTCPKETSYGPAICGKCVEAGGPSADLMDDYRHVVRQRDILLRALDSRPDDNAVLPAFLKWSCGVKETISAHIKATQGGKEGA